ncbi:MAG TPA: hemerythrin domain-containing protein [Qipengyuania sp.]|nr:hemerythrin domain-containing protein [Qipengyuania sp.]
MSVLDKVAAAVTPAASDEDRAEARRKADMLAREHGWLQQILGHHRDIESAFAEALSASAPEARHKACKQLGMLLTGHSMAEEAVIYPAVSLHDGKGHAAMAYEEQSMAKVQMARLEMTDPMSEEWREKLEHIQGAVQQHVYQEEKSWFPEVAEAITMDESEMLTARYREEAGRYFG